MATRSVLASVTISFFVHATEDGQRIVRELCTALELDPAGFSVEKLRGHYGNELASYGLHETSAEADRISAKLWRRLDDASKTEILSLLPSSIDEHGSLYVRIDRQSLASQFSVAFDEPIHIRLKPRWKQNREEMVGFFRRMIIA